MKAKLTTMNLLERANFVNKFTLFRSVSLGVLVVMNFACQKDIELADRSKRVEYFPWGISSWSIVNEDGIRAQLFQVEVTRIADPNHRRISLHLENTIGSKCTSQNLEIDEKSPTTTDEDKNEWVIADFSGNSEKCYLKKENGISIDRDIAEGKKTYPSQAHTDNYLSRSLVLNATQNRINGPINFGSKHAMVLGPFWRTGLLLNITKGKAIGFALPKNIIDDKASDYSYKLDKSDFASGLSRVFRNEIDQCYKKQNLIFLLDYIVQESRYIQQASFQSKPIDQNIVNQFYAKAFDRIKIETAYPCETGGDL
jgi:hypothetical protein